MMNIASVRSLRLTDSTWEALGVRAESLGITRGDLLEQMVRDNDYGCPSNTWMEATALPSNTWKNNAAQPSNTREEEEIERLRTQVQRLSQENALLVERDQENSLVPSLEALRDRILSNLKLGILRQGIKLPKKL